MSAPYTNCVNFNNCGNFSNGRTNTCNACEKNLLSLKNMSKDEIAMKEVEGRNSEATILENKAAIYNSIAVAIRLTEVNGKNDLSGVVYIHEGKKLYVCTHEDAPNVGGGVRARFCI